MHNNHQLATIIMAIMAMYVAGVVLVTMSVAMSYSEYLSISPSSQMGRTASAPAGSRATEACSAEGAPPPRLHYPTSCHKFGST